MWRGSSTTMMNCLRRSSVDLRRTWSGNLRRNLNYSIRWSQLNSCFISCSIWATQKSWPRMRSTRSSRSSSRWAWSDKMSRLESKLSVGRPLATRSWTKERRRKRSSSSQSHQCSTCSGGTLRSQSWRWLKRSSERTRSSLTRSEKWWLELERKLLEFPD